MRRRSSKDTISAATSAYFDFQWDEPEIKAKPDVDPLAVIDQACRDWTSKGNMIVRYTFGVKIENCFRDEHGKLHGAYVAVGERCDPLGILLIGQPCGFMIAAVAHVLGVDEFWIVGFCHSIDRLSVSVIGKKLEVLMKSESYRDGREAGRLIASRYIKDEKPAREIAA